MATIHYLKCDVCKYINDINHTDEWVRIKCIDQNCGPCAVNIDLCSWECLQKFMEQFKDTMTLKSKKDVAS